MEEAYYEMVAYLFFLGLKALKVYLSLKLLVLRVLMFLSLMLSMHGYAVEVYLFQKVGKVYLSLLVLMKEY